jgi:penicillin-binding protein 1C
MFFYRMKPIPKFLLILLAIAILSTLAWLATVFYGLPDVTSLPERLNQASVRITDRNGRILYEILPESGGRHAALSFEDIPQCMLDATIAVEDENFYQNPGVDPVGILRAFWINLRGGETIAGGSTITQQVARTLLLSEQERGERTLRRKLREAVLAWQITRHYSKNEILALYLNQSYYGGLAYGVEAASQTYFGKPATELLLPECALLAGLAQAPSLYDPYTNPDLARQRQGIVLGLMEQDGYITPEQRQQAEAFPLYYNPVPYPVLAPHFVWMVRNELDSLYADGRLDPYAALVVRTTLNLDYQQIAEAAITRNLARFHNDDPALDRNVNNAALVAMDPHSGDILALVGSADYFDNSIHGAINMATSLRQPGSAFKPFIYALALDPQQASPWTAATPILDVITTFIDPAGQPYTPQDYDEREHGPIPVRQALASSLNIPAVKTLDHVGVAAVVNLAGQLGINSLANQDPGDLSLALGGGEMSLLELTSAYATFANEGAYPGHTLILDVRDLNRNLLYQPERPAQPRIFDPRIAWLISDILSDDHARSMGFGINSTLKLDRTTAVKTGTTSNFHDNWTIGYTPDLVVGVWVGNAGYEAMHNVNGLTGAAPIWNEVIRIILQGQPDRPFVRPAGMVKVEICDLSGLLPTADCPHVRTEWFIAGTEPTTPDNIYHTLIVDSATGQLAGESTPPERRVPILALDLPVEASNWAREHGLPLLSDYLSSDNTPADNAILHLILPRPNTSYRLVDTFDQAAQQLPLEAVAGQGVTGVSFWVDGALLETVAAPPYRTWWPLAVGEHTIYAEGLLPDGSQVTSETVTITVTR